MVTDRGDDELRSIDDGGSVTLSVDGAAGDDVPLLEFALPVASGAIVIAAVDRPNEPSSGAQIDFDVPVVVTFAKVEAVTVDCTSPLFGRPATVAVHDHTRVVSQPGLEIGLSCFVGGAGLLTVPVTASSRVSR
jgi:hypothetical protein